MFNKKYICFCIFVFFGFTLVCQYASAQNAATPLPAEDGSFYFGWGWIIFFSIVLPIMLNAITWVNRDSDVLQLSRINWNIMLVFSAVLLLPITFVFPIPAVGALIGLIIFWGFFSWYVIIRNQVVDEQNKVFTSQHIKHVLQAKLSSLGIKYKVEAEAEEVDTRHYEVILSKQNGEPISRTINEKSEAVTILKNLIGQGIESRTTEIRLVQEPEQIRVFHKVDGHYIESKPLQSDIGKNVIHTVDLIADIDKKAEGEFIAETTLKSMLVWTRKYIKDQLENLSMKIAAKDREVPKLDKLGMSLKTYNMVQEIMKHKDGLMLIAGPGDSGKTTTLYSILSAIDRYANNVEIIAYRPEYNLENVAQVSLSVMPKPDYVSTFQRVLLNDPNIIALDNIKDLATLELALQAATAEHLVFAEFETKHDTTTTLMDLVKLGAKSHLVSNAMLAVLVQRLVRKLCLNCRVPYIPDDDILEKLNLPREKIEYFYKANGCQQCNNTGYSGRTGIFELLPLNNPALRELVRNNASPQQLLSTARQAGLTYLQEDGVVKIIEGVTSLQEVVAETKQ